MKNSKFLLFTLAAAPLLVSQVVKADTETATPVGASGTLLAQNQPRPANAPAGVAAEVNGEKILTADVERAVNAVKSQDPALQADTDEAKKALANIREQHIDNLITHSLLSQEAKKLKLAPTKEQVDKAMVTVKEGMSDAEFAKALAADGKTPADLRTFVTEELGIRELTNRVTGDVVISDADIKKYYDENPNDFMSPETAKASHILFAFKPGMTDADKVKLKATATEILRRAKLKPDTFGALAKQYSQDPGSKDQGGSLGDEFFRGQMVTEFADAVWANPVKSIVGPIQTAFGYHIIRIDQRNPTTKLPLTEVQEELKGFLLVPKKKAALDAKLKVLREAATIKRYS
jgi:parvulin-like peptidyl-prolyl isomerase